MIDRIVILGMFMMPYVLLGENTSNIICFIVGTGYIFLNRKNQVQINKKVVCILSLFISSVLISNIVTRNTIFSYSALTIYINILIYYFVFLILIDNIGRKKLYSTALIGIITSIILSTIVESIFLNIRIGGNTYEDTKKMYDSADYNNKYLHNTPLSIAYEFGIISCIAYIVFSVYLIWINRKKQVFLLLGLVFIQSLFEFNFAYTISMILPIFIYICSDLEQKEETLIDFNKMKVILISLIIFMMGLGSYEVLVYSNTIKGLETISKLELNDYRVSLNLGIKNLKEDNIEEAEINLEKSNKINNKNWKIKLALALSFLNEKKGNIQEAINYQYEYLELNEYCEEGYKRLEILVKLR